MEGKLKKKVRYPTKATMNLAASQRNTLSVKGTVLPCLALVVILAVVIQFAILAPLQRVNELEQQTIAMENILGQLQARTADFDLVKEEYDRYFAQTNTGAELLVDRILVLNVLETVIPPRATARSCTFSGNTLSLVLYGMDLDGAAPLLQTLYTIPQVVAVDLYTVQNPQDTVASISMTITLQAGEG